MELRVLNYFLMIAREENITRAAELLHVSQPTLSRQIARLEEELGVKLFTRQSHKISLTESGLLLRRRAEEMRQLSDKIFDEMSEDNQELTGQIAIGSGEFLSMNELAELIVKFHKKYPLVTFDFQSGNSKDIESGVERGLIDLALLVEPVNTEKYEFVRINQQEHWGVLTRNDSNLASLKQITPQDLEDESIILSKGPSMQSELRHWLGDSFEKVKIVSYYNLLYNSVILAKKGLGSVLCLDLEASYEGMTFVPLQPALTYSSVLAWKADQISSKSVTTFVEFAKKYL
ncbi:LysR family transcriptional regulator [Companilactobacillus halodurans]|uniref:LysR family transcriptional regulator n=1 Tax=Companilactobacillus halodurans TaxID=2584183 RepID=A0A5P0ZRA9_9LACO|nr:LysR family transcriptional regulator [Companilactobacillus halodurans]MQS76595.1 LysR family transcriptional regulator [Companilactobacillus halodurans]MQS98200.1 LysR family transcriptional regulator [Companilactobacillus halodurans]